MLVYFIMLALITFLAFAIYITDFNKESKDKLFLTISFFILTTVSAFRATSVGTDTESYQSIFLKYVYGVPDYHSEIGYATFNKIIAMISSDPQSIVIASSIIINFGVMHFIYKNSTNAWLSVYLYITLFYYFFSFNYIRQFIAISIVLIAWSFLKDKKIFTFIVFVVLAASFHTSALIALLLIFVFLARKKTKLIPLILLSTIFGLLGMDVLFKYAFELFPRYEDYYTGDFSQGSGIRSLILYLVIFIATFIFRKKKDEEYNMLLSIATICAALGILSYEYFMFSRPSIYFNVFAIIIIPKITSNFKGKESLIANYVVIILGFAYLLYYLFLGWHDVTPYKFFM